MLRIRVIVSPAILNPSHRFACDSESKPCEARRKFCYTQNPNRVLAEGVRYMAQDSVFDVWQPTIGINQIAIAIFRDRIDA